MNQPKIPDPVPEGYRVVFCTTYKHAKTGKIMVASEYGLKAWCFLVPTNGQ